MGRIRYETAGHWQHQKRIATLSTLITKLKNLLRLPRREIWYLCQNISIQKEFLKRATLPWGVWGSEESALITNSSVAPFPSIPMFYWRPFFPKGFALDLELRKSAFRPISSLHVGQFRCNISNQKFTGQVATIFEFLLSCKCTWLHCPFPLTKVHTVNYAYMCTP